MIKIFVDTSSLIKIYVKEKGSLQLMEFLAKQNPKIVISELGKIDFYSTIYKLKRMKVLTEFDTDFLDFVFQDNLKGLEIIKLNDKILIDSTKLIKKYGDLGLRTLDAIQLACAINNADEIDYFSTHDKKLAKCMELEKLNVVNYD